MSDKSTLVVLVAPAKLAPQHPLRVAGAFYLGFVGELGFDYNAVECTLLFEQWRRGRAEAVREVVAARRSASWPIIRSALFSVLSDVVTRHSIQSRVRFRSGELWGPERRKRPRAGSLLFYFCRHVRRVILLVFVLVSAAIGDKSGFRFKWLWL